MKNVVVHGSGFKVTVPIDSEISGEPLIEAATQALEVMFGNGPDVGSDVDVKITHENPNVGIFMQTYFEEDKDDETKHVYVSTFIAAQNAGLLWIANQLREAEIKFNKQQQTGPRDFNG